MSVRHFIDTQDFSKTELLVIVELARRLKEAGRAGACPPLLAGASLLMLTDVGAVYRDWRTPGARALRSAHPKTLAALTFPAGSMGPKLEVACRFARGTRRAYIGALDQAIHPRGALRHPQSRASSAASKTVFT